MVAKPGAGGKNEPPAQQVVVVDPSRASPLQVVDGHSFEEMSKPSGRKFAAGSRAHQSQQTRKPERIGEPARVSRRQMVAHETSGRARCGPSSIQDNARVKGP